MSTHANISLYRLLLVGCIAALLVSGVAIASLAISSLGFQRIFAAAGPGDEAAAPANMAPEVRAHSHRCPECGVIESTHEIKALDKKRGLDASDRIAAGNLSELENKPVRKYETTVRMQDGSMHVITDTDLARWRPGERVMLIF